MNKIKRFKLDDYVGQTVHVQFLPDISNPKFSIDEFSVYYQGREAYIDRNKAFAANRDKIPYTHTRFYSYAILNGEPGILEYGRAIRKFVVEKATMATGKPINVFDLRRGHIMEFDVEYKVHHGRNYLDYVNKKLIKGTPLWDGTDEGKMFVKKYLSKLDIGLKGYGERMYKSDKILRKRNSAISKILS